MLSLCHKLVSRVITWGTLRKHNAFSAYIDLNGDGVHLYDESNSGQDKIGDWLPGVSGYEKFSCDPQSIGLTIGENDSHGCYLHRWDGSQWELVWQSVDLTWFRNFAGGRGKPTVADIDNDGQLEGIVAAWYEV